MTFCTATVSLIPLPRIVSRSDIECPGDTVPYNCSIQSNSETLLLLWHVTFPGQMPLTIVYNDTDNMTRQNGYVSASLTSYTRDEYIESILTITVQPETSTEHLVLQCSIEDLGNDSSEVLINSSGK